MESTILTCKNFNQIKFPLWSINSKYLLEDETSVRHPIEEKIIDDKTSSGETLAKRRLTIDPDELYTFQSMCRDFSELVRDRHYKFRINNDGQIVVYIKTRWAQIKKYKIHKTTENSVWLVGVNYPIKSLFSPPVECKVCEALVLGTSPLCIWSYIMTDKTRRFI